MGKKIIFIVDTLADLPSTLVASRSDIRVIDIPIMAIYPGRETLTFNGLTADTFEEVDELVQQGYVSKTSLPVIYETKDEEKHGVMSVERMTRAELENGNDVLYLAINSAISGNYGMVSGCYNEINDDYKGCHAACVDTQCASTGLAMLLADILNVYDGGQITNIDGLIHYIEHQRRKIGMLFTWFEFNYIKNSGKVTALPAFLGKVFGFHPFGSVEYMNNEERPLTTLSSSIRGTRKFCGVLARFIKTTIANPRGIITVAHGNCEERIQPILETLHIYLPEATILSGDDWRCGAAIQAHGGPTSVHINYHRRSCSINESQELVRLAMRA